MADVGRWVGRNDRCADNGPERGQLILVTALSMAILFVALALILNTAIYTENLATRSGDIGGATDAVRYHDAARDGVGGVIKYVNVHNNTDHQTLRDNLSAGVASYRNLSARQFTQGDRAVETTLNATDHGTRIAQDDESRNFTDRSGTADWTVATDVNNTRAVRFYVHRDVLDILGNSPFRMVLSDGGSTWELEISQDSGFTDIIVTVNSPSGGSCSVTTNEAWINVTDGTFAGEECAPLESFADEVPPTYDIRFENGDDIEGTYSMVVDNDDLADDVADGTNPHLVEEGDGQPFAAHAIYSATVDVVYETSRLHYEATVRVAPEEPDG